MKTAGVADLKAHLSRYLERVKAGQEVTITERGLPVARLVPFERAGQARSRRDRLVRAGVLLPGRGKVRTQLLTPPVGDPALGRRVLDALVEDRRDDR
jgi:prevent-host-death family protein